METEQYTKRMERKLIEEFRIKFFEKVGYFPEVKSRVKQLPRLTLPGLESLFLDHIPPNHRAKGLGVRKKNREMTCLRYIFCRFAKEMGYNLVEIGKYLKRDHTTIIHALKTFNDLIETDFSFQTQYADMEETIYKSCNLLSNEPPVMEYMPETQHQPESALFT